MNNQLQKLPISQIVDLLKRFRLIIFLALFAGIYIYLFFFISSLTNKKPNQTAIEQELQTVKRLKVDDNSIKQMLRLTEESIEVKALYEDARNNPFAENSSD